MKNSKYKELFQQAGYELENVNSELSKPKNNEVKYDACVSSRRALYFLVNIIYQFYGEKNNEELDDHPTLDEMVKYCADYNEKIRFLDFHEVYCRKRDVLDENALFCCDEVSKIEACSEVADKLKGIVIEVVWDGKYPQS